MTASHAMPACSSPSCALIEFTPCGAVEGTISNAASLCLHDTSIDKPARRNRAKALQKLGVLFSSIAEALDAQSAQRLRISGLKSRPEVNGCYGLVEGINSSTGRVNVKVRCGKNPDC